MLIEPTFCPDFIKQFNIKEAIAYIEEIKILLQDALNPDIIISIPESSFKTFANAGMGTSELRKEKAAKHYTEVIKYLTNKFKL